MLYAGQYDLKPNSLKFTSTSRHRGNELPSPHGAAFRVSSIAFAFRLRNIRRLVELGLKAGVSLAGFVWNVWSKFIYPKPAVRISFAMAQVVEQGSDYIPSVLRLSATNLGPGEVSRPRR